MNTTRALGIMILCILTGLGAISASADQITLASSSQNVVLTGDGLGDLSAQLGTFGGGVYTLSGIAIGGDGELGSYSFVTTGVPTFGPNNGSGVFPWASGGSTVFNFIDTTDGDSNLTATITYVLFGDGTKDPHMDFTSPIGDFIISGSTLTCTFVTTCNIDNVALVLGATASGSISSGQVLRPVPEPATSGLLGAGLVSLLALAGWRKKFRTIG